MPLRYGVAGAVLNFLLPGAGHLYLGRASRFMYPAAAFAAFTLGLGIFGGMSSFYGMASFLVLFAGLVVYGVVDAFIVAYGSSSPAATWYSRWYVLVAWALFLVAIAVVFPMLRESVLGYSVFRAPSESMSPTIRRGETFLVDTRAFADRGPEVGAIAVLRNPRNGLVFVRRVSARPSVATASFASDNSSGKASDRELQEIETKDLIGRPTQILYSPEFGRLGKRVE